MRSSACLALVLLVLTAATAAAVMGMGMQRGPDVWGGLEFKPVVGHWAEYRVTTEGDKPMTMRVAVVGQEDEAYWYETAMSNDKDERTIMKMLVSGNPQDKDSLKKMIMKSGDEPAMEMPIQMMQGMPGKAEPEPEVEERQVKTVDLGVESIIVPAGTFEAHHWRFASDEAAHDIWVSAGVGPYGAVKSASADFEMVLLAYGDEAVSLITEEPQSMSFPGFKMPKPAGK